MADEEATQAPQQDVKPEIKQDVQHLTLTVVHQVSLYDDQMGRHNCQCLEQTQCNHSAMTITA